MSLRELQYLVAVAEHRHFGRAAKACHISQPTLSTQLKKLESYLGVTLFERTNKVSQITPIGVRLAAQARRALAEAATLVEIARKNSALLCGPLSLGIIPTLSPYLLPWLVPPLQRSYPELELIVHEDMTDPLLERLHNCQLDAALLALPLHQPGLEFMPLFDERFYFACPSTHPLAKKTAVRGTDLNRSDLLLLTDGHCLREQALSACGYSESKLQDRSVDYRCTSLETLRQMVAAGMGCTLLPAMAVHQAKDARVRILQLAEPASRRIGLVWRSHYPGLADMRELGACVHRHLPEHVQACRSAR